MRLLLIVQRQSLPPVQVLWTASGLRPGLAANAANLTIAQLLEQVNEVIPLEAEFWGLEDYAVEVRGFECLHFAGLDQVLKDDDEVTIRPLQTTDLRYRKMSGRHQISTDGRHLIDGVAFGRPFLRHGDRPPIRIPPRKRIRLTNDDEEEDQEVRSAQITDGNHDIALRAGFRDGSDERLSNSDDDEDYTLDDEEEVNLEAELRDIANEAQGFEEEVEIGILEDVGEIPTIDSTVAELRNATRSRRRQQQHQGLGLQGEGILALVEENNRQYPTENINPFPEVNRQEHHPKSTKKKARHSRIHKPRLNSVQRSAQSCTDLERLTRRSSSASVKNVRFQDNELKTPATVLETDGTEESDDEDFDPDKLDENSSSESNKENIEPDIEATSDLDDSSSTTSSTSESNTSETSSSLASSSVSSSEHESNISISKRIASPIQHSKVLPNLQQPRDNEFAIADQLPSTVPPGQGTRETRTRNQRRRDRKQLLHLQSIGILPSSATKADYMKWSESKLGIDRTKQKTAAEPIRSNAGSAAAFEAKRQSLLESIVGDGVEVVSEDERWKDSEMMDVYEHSTVEPSKANKKASDPLVSLNGHSSTADSVRDTSQPAKLIKVTPLSSVQDPNETAKPETTTKSGSELPQRRAKLDVASSRRMLFGSLGLRTPKNKDEESEIREKLMENVKSNPQSQAISAEPVEASPLSQSSEADDNWRDKIVLKAVECCRDGIKLSTPPFPFVQRWDPQQRGAKIKVGKFGVNRGKKRKRNNPQFYDEDLDYYVDSTAPVAEDWENCYEVEKGLKESENQLQEQSHAVSDEYQVAVDKQLMRDTNELPSTAGNHITQVNDLPELPEDITSCLSLNKDLAIPGAIVSFKQLEMSLETQWQPQISEYKIAVIDKVEKDGKLEMTLARRDRTIKERYYDEQTGERLYSKFEAPDDDDNGDEDDSGVIELSLAEMIEPKLIKATESEKRLKLDQEPNKTTKTLDPSIIGIVRQELHQTDSREYDSKTEEHDLPKTTMNNVLPNQAIYDESIQAGDQDMPDADPEHEPLEITEEARREIAIMIKDAGFHSSIHCDVDQGLGNQEASTTPNTHQQAALEYSKFSPKFNGFSSTPPSRLNKRIDSDSIKRGLRSPSASNEEHESSSPPSHVTLRKRRGQAEDLHDQGTSYIFLSQHDEDGDDLCMASVKRKRTNRSSNIDSSSKRITSASPTSSDVRGTPHHTIGRNAQYRKEKSNSDGTNSDGLDDFPTVEDIVSGARSTLGTSVSTDKDIDLTTSSRLGTSKENKSLKEGYQSQSEPPSQQKERSFSIADVLASSNGEDSDYEMDMPPTASQAPTGSQVVDLTLSSDAVDPEDSEYEERTSKGRLPKGPGWVQKTRSGRKSEVARKKKRQKLGSRKTRSM